MIAETLAPPEARPETSLADVLDYFRPMQMQTEHLEALGGTYKTPVVEWMEEHFILPAATGRLSGPWSLAMTPFWRPVLEWFGDKNTRLIWVIAATQTGKSTNLAGLLAYLIDVDPGPAKFIMPDQNIAKKRLKKIRAAYKQSPKIMRHFGNNIKNLFVGEPMEINGMMMVMGWPTSPATLSDDTCRYVFGDECCEWKEVIKDDTDPIEKLHNRVRTFEEDGLSKEVYVTSPKNAGDLTHKKVKECQLWQIWTQCPHCEEYSVPDFKNVNLEKDADGHLMPARKYKGCQAAAWYACPECGALWTELERWASVTRCRWAPEGCKINPAGEIVGEFEDSPYKAIHFGALLVHPMFTTIATLAADYAKAQAALKLGKIAAWRNFINNQLGKFWEVRDRETKIEVIDGHVSSGDTAYRMRQVPRGVQLLTVGFDVQADHIWVVTKGYGYQNQQWLIHAGRLETGHTGRIRNWAIITSYLRTEWVSQADTSVVHFIQKAAVDCRYQRAERDEESTVVYDYCLTHKEMFANPVMGFGRKRMKDTGMKRIKPLAGSELVRFNVNVDLYKDRAWETLHNPEVEPGPGYMHLPIDVPETIKKQLCSEEQVLVDGLALWRVKDGHVANHIWDCNIYADCAAELAQVESLRDEDPVADCLRRRAEAQALADQKSRRGGGFQEGIPRLR